MAAPDTLVDLDGKLAVYLYGMTDSKRPVYVHSYLSSVSIPARDHTSILGWYVSRQPGSLYGRAWSLGNYTEVTVNFTGWELVHRETPIEKPRDGREYTWEWSWGKWIKDYFPRCVECYNYHNPTWEYNADSSQCERPKAPRKSTRRAQAVAE